MAVTATASIELPSQLAAKDYRHIKLGSSGERLKIPIELGWNIFNLDELDTCIKDRQTKWDDDEASGRHEDLRANGKYVPRRPVFRNRLNNYAYDEPEFIDWLKRGNNYGVTSSGGLIKLESDDIERWQALGVLDLLPETFTVQSSSPNRQHFYYIGPEVADSPLKDPETNEDIGHIRGTGEAGGHGGMVVGPGSLHPLNVRYMVVKDLPVASISQEALDKVKAKFVGSEKLKTDGQETKTNKQLNQNKIRGNGNANPNKYSDPFLDLTCIDVLGPGWDWHYESDQMVGQNPYPGHDNTPGDPHHALTIKSNDREFFCFECQDGKLGGGGVSKLIAIRAGIMKCNDSRSSPDGKDWWDTVRYAFNEGLIDKETARAAGLNVDAEPELSLEEIEARFKADPDSITTPGALAGLRRLSSFKLAGFFKKAGITGDQKKILLDLLTPIQTTEEQTGEEIPEDIQKIAASIADHGKPLKYMLNTFNQTHKGDRLHAESQFIGFGLQSAYNTKGVFGTWDGPSGKGKSDGAKACVRQLPEEYTIISSVTAKSLYHRAKDGGILPGSVLYLDDKNIEAGSGLEETLKRIQTFFQEGAEHETLDGKGGYIKTKLPPRLLVVRTYVDSSDSDEQLKNRSMDFGVDSSKEIDKEVCDLVLKLGEDGQTTDIITRRTLICRALWRDIKSHAYRVKHPASSQLIEFSDVSNRRNSSLFLDMVVGLACINHKQCDTEDGPNGEKILYSTYADYVEAARLFNSQGDYLGTRLDKAEFEAVQYIKAQGNEGGSINGIFTHLADTFPNDGWNTQKVRRLMDGRPEREIKGLADKVPGIETRWEPTKEGGKYKVYLILGELALGVQVTVHDPRTKNISSEDLSHLSRRFPKMGKGVNDSSIPPIPTPYPKHPNKENGRDKSSLCDEESKSEKSNLSLGGFDFGKTGKRGLGNEALDVGKAPFPGGKLPGKDGKTGMGPHPRKDAPPLPPLICAKCGEDLTGHGQITKGDKVYCAKVGCGYPKRGEGRAEA